jgi:K+-transporting ATPase c subunit
MDKKEKARIMLLAFITIVVLLIIVQLLFPGALQEIARGFFEGQCMANGYALCK